MQLGFTAQLRLPRKDILCVGVSVRQLNSLKSRVICPLSLWPTAVLDGQILGHPGIHKLCLCLCHCDWLSRAWLPDFGVTLAILASIAVDSTAHCLQPFLIPLSRELFSILHIYNVVTIIWKDWWRRSEGGGGGGNKGGESKNSLSSLPPTFEKFSDKVESFPRKEVFHTITKRKHIVGLGMNSGI